MFADIITIGDEILIGQVIDTNSAYIAEELSSMGITIKEIRSISDQEKHIIKTLDESVKTSDIIIITGGLGPTNDDITKKTLASYFKSELVTDRKVLDHVMGFMNSRGVRPLEVNIKQAEVPKNCRVLFNPHGTAPGMLFEKEKKIIISLPGVPYEMKHLIKNEVIPLLKERCALPVIIRKTYLTSGVGESVMAERLKDFEKELPENVKLAYLPSPGILRLRLTISGSKGDYLKHRFNDLDKELTLLLGRDLFGTGSESLEQIIGKLLTGMGMTLSTAESCTGGTVSGLIVSVPGASAYFKGSIIAYDNNVKINTLGVEQDLLIKDGAVSEAVVIRMAETVSKIMKTDFAIATSGIAGPSGSTHDKPVGTTWIAIKSPQRIRAFKYGFGDHRGRNIAKTSVVALNLLRQEIDHIVENSEKKV